MLFANFAFRLPIPFNRPGGGFRLFESIDVAFELYKLVSVDLSLFSSQQLAETNGEHRRRGTAQSLSDRNVRVGASTVAVHSSGSVSEIEWELQSLLLFYTAWSRALPVK